jgi:hypothetical protein
MVKEIVTLETMKKDTLSNGKNSKVLGQIAQFPVDENETYLDKNFDKSTILI